MEIIHIWWKNRDHRFLCDKDKTGSDSLGVWRTPNFRSVQKYTPNKVMLHPISYRKPQTGCRHCKRILTKEKLDKQLTGQTSTSPSMSIREGTDKRVSFNARDELGDKIDKLTMVMSKLAATDNHERRPFRPQIYKSRGQDRSYNQGG